MKKEFRELLFNQTLNAHDVTRYSGTYLVRPESLSSHIYEVSMLSYTMANILNTRYDEKIDIKVVLEKALLHDIDETSTGDIVRNVKHYSPETKEALDLIADQSVKTISQIEGLEVVYEVWNSSKEGKEGLLIKLVDMLVVARKASVEVDVYSNYGALKTVSELTYHLDRLSDGIVTSEVSAESAGYLLDLVEEVSDHIKLLQSKYYDQLNTYNLGRSIINARSDS